MHGLAACRGVETRGRPSHTFTRGREMELIGVEATTARDPRTTCSVNDSNLKLFANLSCVEEVRHLMVRDDVQTPALGKLRMAR
jgi:hypothetical protein